LIRHNTGGRRRRHARCTIKENAMQANVGTIDRAVRVMVGLGLIAAAYAGALGPWAWVGLVPLVTGAVGTCPIYQLLGIDSCRLGKS
jgi:hypothetical protein